MTTAQNPGRARRHGATISGMTRRAASITAYIAALVAPLLTACSSSTALGDNGAVDSLTALPRALTVVERDAVSAGNSFALRLLRASDARAAGKNVLLSPLSVSLALGMTMNGAAGETESQMAGTLGWRGRTRAEINTAYRDLMTMLPTLDPAVTVTLANAIWVRTPLVADTGFAGDVRRYFNAEIRSAATPSAMFDAVNAWGNTQTKGLVPKVLDTPPPDDLLMLLANAVYFDGAWRDRFESANTKPGPFRLESGTDVSVPLMTRDGRFRGFTDGALFAAELAYGNTAYTMLLLAPQTGTVSSLVATLDSARLATITNGLATVSASTPLTLPRFRVSGSLELGPHLAALGMPRAFTDAAQFPRLLGPSVKIGFVRHGVAVDVDEAGTRAAAVTSVGVVPTSVPLPLSYRFDKPFVFMIRERFAGTVLFVGVVRDPRA
jgi:serpin B